MGQRPEPARPPGIAPATVADIPELCRLLGILFTQEEEFEPDASRQSAALRQIITHEKIGRILVLREGGNIVGMVSLLFTISTACGGKVAFLEDMVVDPARRNDGLGSALLQAVIELAGREGCSRITLLTDRANSPAIRLYGRHGFSVSTMLPLRLALV